MVCAVLGPARCAVVVTVGPSISKHSRHWSPVNLLNIQGFGLISLDQVRVGKMTLEMNTMGKRI